MNLSPKPLQYAPDYSSVIAWCDWVRRDPVRLQQFLMSYTEKPCLTRQSSSPTSSSKALLEAALPPSPSRVQERRLLEQQFAQTMWTTCFTLKCKLYKDVLQKIVAENPTRTYIARLIDPPTLQLNEAEERLLKEFMNDETSFKKAISHYTNSDQKAKSEILHELLNSLTNRLLFYILVEYRSWFPQDTARSQMTFIVLDAIWPRHPFRIEAQDYVELFVAQRSKNFRDVLSRVKF